MTSNELGRMLGVSGRTVLRWETDQSLPTPDDVAELARCLGLSEYQRVFLNRVFIRRGTPRPPAPEYFQRVAGEVLQSAHPAILMDSLYYVRARNSYTALFYPPTHPVVPSGQHAIEMVLEAAMKGLPGLSPQLVASFVHDVWLNTSIHCGYAEYERMLGRLVRLPGFKQLWLGGAMGRESGSADASGSGSSPSGAPRNVTRGDMGSWRVFMVRVSLPPLYHLREQVPIDLRAIECLHDVQRGGPPTVHFDPSPHWAIA